LLKRKKIFHIIAILIIVASIATVSIITVLIVANSPDNLPPLVQISTPNDGETISGTIPISFTASDQQGFVQNPQILIDGTVVEDSSYSYQWDTTQAVDGEHNILCRARDRTIWGSAEISVTIHNEVPDDTAPSISIISPIEGTTISDTVVINMVATDVNGISTYAIYINDILRSSSNLNSWNTISESDGNYTIRCEATDPSNNKASKSIWVIVNNSMVIIPPKTFKVMTFNVKDSGEDPSYTDWKEVVKEENADIIMFIETGSWDDNTNQKLNQYLSEFNSYFSSEDPYVGYCTQGISYLTDGAAIFSRYPIISYSQITHVFLDNSSSYEVTHDFFDIEIIVYETSIHVIGSHLKALPGANNEQIREKEQEGIINYMDNLGDIPIIYLGDLNSFSPEDWGLNTLQSGLGYGPLSMFIFPYDNPETGSDYSSYSSLIHEWVDVHRTLNPTDWGITCPDYNSRIDFIYVNQWLSFKLVNSTTGDTDHANTGSDHYNIDVYFDLN